MSIIKIVQEQSISLLKEDEKLNSFVRNYDLEDKIEMLEF